MASIDAAPPVGKHDKLGGTRLIVGYVVVAAFLLVAIAVSVSIGQDEEAQPGIAGFYTSDSACLGERFKLVQSGQFVDIGDGASGKLRLRDDRLTGTVDCAAGGTMEVDLAVAGEGAAAKIAGTVGSERATASFAEELPEPGTSAKPAKKRSGEETFVSVNL